MKNIVVYIHGENSCEVHSIEVPANTSIKEIIEKYRQQFPNAGDPEEIEIFLEDEHGHKHKDCGCDEGGVGHKGHVHCHRCKSIKVVVSYNNETVREEFSPSATTKQIMKKIIKAFQIDPEDANDYLLKLKDTTILNPKDHIGSFTNYPDCTVKLFLTAAKPVQG